MARLLRVQAIFEHDNGLPRDAATSTFHFYDDDDTADPGVIATDVLDFYTVAAAGAGGAVDRYLSTVHDSVYAKVYEVNDVIVGGKVVSNSGPPIETTITRALGAKLNPKNLPSEVAIVVSMRDTVDVGTPRARRTGRIYFGPLNGDADAKVDSVISRPATGLLTDLRLAMAKLADESATDGAPLVVYSRPFPGRAAIERPGRTTLPALPARPVGSYGIVDQVWTDDAYDTQRRRGERATAKTILAV